MRLIGLAVVIGLALLAKPLGAGSQPAGQKVRGSVTWMVPHFPPTQFALKRFGTVCVNLAT
jgi:hypothetical protein